MSSIPDLPLKELIGLVITIVVGMTWVDTRYTLQNEFDGLVTDVSNGHAIAETNAKIYTAARTWSDLVGRESLYQAKQDAGIITDAEVIRWERIKIDVRNAREELNKLNAELIQLTRN